MNQTYYTLILSHVRSQDEDAITYFCFEAGAGGVSEELEFTQMQDNYEPETLHKEIKTLNVYFESVPSMDLIEDLKQRFSGIQIEQKEDQKKDWREEWKKGLKSFELVDGIWVVPSWLERPDSAREIIKIDPGMAFGTGTHETTNLASQMISTIDFNETDQLLDVGTGTGILALLASFYGSKNSIGIEIDEPAREVAKENVIINNQSDKVKILDSELKDVPGTFEVVIANIIDGVLVQLKDDLKSRVKAGGHLVLTGILNERRDQFVDRFDFTGFKVINESQRGEWTGIHLQKS